MKRKGLRWLLLALIPLACLALGFGIGAARNRRPDTAQQLRETALTCGDWSLSNTELGYYFWSEYFYYINSGAEPQPDTSVPLGGQSYDAEQSWYDYFLSLALEKVRGTMSLVFSGEEEGYVMSDAYAEDLETVCARFSDYALAGGYETAEGGADLEAYLRSSYGEAATQESFFSYLHDSYYAASYSDELYYGYTPAADEVEAYFSERAEDYYEAYGVRWDDPNPVSIRTVTVTGENAAARAEAMAALWQAEGGTEEGFSALARDDSQDEYASAGGLREGLTAADVEDAALSAWCFDPLRQSGDWTLLDTQEGTIIVFFSAREALSRAYSLALEDMRYENYRSCYSGLTEAYSFSVRREAIVIATPEGLYDEK